MCLNDGDLEDGQGGQKGWTGWGPYSIVFGKNSPATGLITLAGDSVDMSDPNRACGSPGANNLALPGSGTVVNDGDEFSYAQGDTDYTNCVWNVGCDGGTGTVTFSAFLSEGNWDYLNLFSDASLVTNSIGPAANNGGIDNSGDLGRFSGTEDPGAVDGVAVVQYISDRSYIEPEAGFTATVSCGGGDGDGGDGGDNCVGDVCVSADQITAEGPGTTWQVTHTLSGSASNVNTIYGTEASPMSIPASYQEGAPFGCNTGGISSQLTAIIATAAYDGWPTVGITEGDSAGALGNIGIDWDAWTDSAGIENDNGAVFFLSQDDGPAESAVVAQFTVDGDWSAAFGAQGRSADGADWQADNIAITN